MADKMRDWIGKRVLLESESREDYGRILYGIKNNSSELAQLIECEPGSKERVEGKSPRYYFVSDRFKELKIPILNHYVNENEIYAIVKDIDYFFKARIKKV